MTKDDEQNIKYILYQTKHGVSLEETLLNLGYVKINPKQKEKKEMRTIKVSESDFEEYEYELKVVCPYCGKDFFFYEYEKWIDKTDYCPKCGKEVHVISEEK